MVSSSPISHCIFLPVTCMNERKGGRKRNEREKEIEKDRQADREGESLQLYINLK